MLVKVYNDKKNKQFIVSVNKESYTCKALWIDEDLHDYEMESEVTDFEVLYVEARVVKVSQKICVIETRIIEVVGEDEE